MLVSWLLLLAIGCVRHPGARVQNGPGVLNSGASAVGQFTPTAVGSEPDDGSGAKYARYPYSVIGGVYDSVLRDSVVQFAGADQGHALHESALRATIQQHHPRELFIAAVVSETRSESILDLALGNPDYEERGGMFAATLLEVTELALTRATELFYLSVQVFQRRYLHPDYTEPLFAHAHSFEEEVDIAGIRAEVEERAFRQNSGSHFRLRRKDRVFVFVSPVATLGEPPGREGYLVVRDQSVVYRTLAAGLPKP